MADPFVAEIRIFPFNFAPRGWALCDGQLLPLSQNTALFSLLGTTKASLDQARRTEVMEQVRREDGIKMAVKRSEAAGGVPTRKRSSLLQLMGGELPPPPKKAKAAAFGPIFASTLGMGVGKEVGSHIPGAVPLEKLEDSAYNQLTDPAQEQELAGIRAESMLSGMINSDDVLSHQDPNTVISHYNELSQLVPNIMQQPAAARSILRQVVTTGGLTPYDIQQLQTMNQIVFGIYPLVYAVTLSLYKKNAATRKMVFDPTHNWTKILGDERVWNAIYNTFFYTGEALVFQLVLGMLIALLLSVLCGALLYRLVERHTPTWWRWWLWAGVFKASVALALLINPA